MAEEERAERKRKPYKKKARKVERERRAPGKTVTGKPRGLKRVYKQRALKTYDGQLEQKHFMAIEYYMRGCSKKEALLRAGYPPTTAAKQQARVFGRVDVQREIERRRQGIRTRTHAMADRIKEELARIAFFNIGTILEITSDGDIVYDFEHASMEELAAIGEVTVEEFVEGRGPGARDVRRVRVKPHDKKAALDSLARIYGMFHDNLTVSPGDGESVEERLNRGRARVREEPGGASRDAIEGEFSEVEAAG